MGLDAKQYFNDNRRDHYWNENKKKYQRYFYRKLIDLKNAINLNTPEADLKLDSYRGLGYMGIGTQGGLSLAIRTEKSIEKREKLGDHVIGTVEIGRHIHKECEKIIGIMIIWLIPGYMKIYGFGLQSKFQRVNTKMKTLELMQIQLTKKDF